MGKYYGEGVEEKRYRTDEESTVTMKRSEYEAALNRAKEAGFAAAFPYREKYDNLVKAVRGIGIVIETLTKE